MIVDSRNSKGAQGIGSAGADVGELAERDLGVSVPATVFFTGEVLARFENSEKLTVRFSEEGVAREKCAKKAMKTGLFSELRNGFVFLRSIFNHEWTRIHTDNESRRIGRRGQRYGHGEPTTWRRDGHPFKTDQTTNSPI